MVVVIDYGLGNLFSVSKAFERVGAEVVISSNPEDIRKADRIVLPGVGAFGDGMDYLRSKGIDKALTVAVIEKQKPFLGICLGMQLLADIGQEYGEYKGLGWISGVVRKLEVEKLGLKIPHIGWNDIQIVHDSPLFRGLPAVSDFYFVHSYQLICQEPTDIAAVTDYGEQITAAIQRKNIFATQFHPEKSQDNGLILIENFMNWQP
ncbi:MAG: imidazole glycerol phosphate synthase subunit HisH [Patescibacteria group bacterium]